MHFLALPRKQKFRKYESTKFAEMLNSKNPNELMSHTYFCKNFQITIGYFRYNLSLIGVAFSLA